MRIAADMKLSVLAGSIAVARLSPDQEIPPWVWRNRAFLSLTYTTDELSIVCPGSSVPADVRSEKDWVAIKVQGPLDFSLTGVLASLTAPLAAHGIPIFAISTFDTDYLLVKEQYLSRAREVLEQAGHIF
jgi:hypothetical protein